jgi:hypothetical protein
MTKLARLVAREEGFFRSGTLPARNHNPGDLRHSPHSEHPGDPNAIGVIDTDADGWDDLDRQLEIYAARLVSVDPCSGQACPHRFMTLRDAVYTFAPPAENDSARYLADVLAGFGGMVDADTRLSLVLEIPADPATFLT